VFVRSAASGNLGGGITAQIEAAWAELDSRMAIAEENKYRFKGVSVGIPNAHDC
jgi:hypothetical protein